MNKTAASALNNDSFAQVDMTDQDGETMRSIIGLKNADNMKASPVRPLGPALIFHKNKNAVNMK